MEGGLGLRSRGGDAGDTPEEPVVSRLLIKTYDECSQALKEVGAISAAVLLENDVCRERRRMRNICKDDHVLLALARRQEQQHAEDRKRRAQAVELNEMSLTKAQNHLTKETISVTQSLTRYRKSKECRFKQTEN